MHPHDNFTSGQVEAVTTSSALRHAAVTIAELTSCDPVFVMNGLDRPKFETYFRYGTTECMFLPVIEFCSRIAPVPRLPTASLIVAATFLRGVRPGVVRSHRTES